MPSNISVPYDCTDPDLRNPTSDKSPTLKGRRNRAETMSGQAQLTKYQAQIRS